jgi:hypothetical protein
METRMDSRQVVRALVDALLIQKKQAPVHKRRILKFGLGDEADDDDPSDAQADTVKGFSLGKPFWIRGHRAD